MKLRVYIASLAAVVTMGPAIAFAQSASPRTATASPQRFDAVYSICTAVVPVTHKDFPDANYVGPGAVILHHFASNKMALSADEPSKIALVNRPQHGELRIDSDGAYIYHPDIRHLGPDQMAFVVEIKGKRLKVIETVWVANVAPEYGGCPKDYQLPPAE